MSGWELVTMYEQELMHLKGLLDSLLTDSSNLPAVLSLYRQWERFWRMNEIGVNVRYPTDWSTGQPREDWVDFQEYRDMTDEQFNTALKVLGSKHE